MEGRLEVVLAPERARAKAVRLAALSVPLDLAEMERRYAKGAVC